MAKTIELDVKDIRSMIIRKQEIAAAPGTYGYHVLAAYDVVDEHGTVIVSRQVILLLENQDAPRSSVDTLCAHMLGLAQNQEGVVNVVSVVSAPTASPTKKEKTPTTLKAKPKGGKRAR